MRRLAFLGTTSAALALGTLAVTATACEGKGGPELTTLTTTLSGEGKEAASITVLEGSPVKDAATISGTNASKATGTVAYAVYSEKECKALVTSAGEVSVKGASVPASSEVTLAGGGTYYWQATYSGDENNAKSVSTCGSEVVTVEAVPPPKIERVDFTNNKELLIDHRLNATGEASMGITGFGENNKVEWQTSTKPEDEKNWPVAYVKQEKPKLTARFSLALGAEEFIQKHLDEKVTVLGVGKLGTTEFKVKAELTKAALEAHKGYFETGVMEDENALPNTVKLYESVPLTWTWKLKAKGQPAFEQALETSSHNFYLTNASTLKGVEDLFTVLDLDTQRVEKEATKQPPETSEIISSIWSEFATRSVGIRWYDVEKGVIHRNGIVMQYYEEHKTTKKNLKEAAEDNVPTCGIESVKELFEKALGKCGAWALAFSWALATEGVSSAVRKVIPSFAAGKCNAEECQFLVKNWEFKGNGGLVGEFPYRATEILDLAGVEGQGAPKNPPAVFGLHYVVEAPKNGTTLYDSAYGNLFKGAKPLEEFQSASIAGFCSPFKAMFEAECRKVPTTLALADPVALNFE